MSRFAFAIALGASCLASSLACAGPLAAAYRGELVCEKLKTAADILHVPLDLSVRDGAIHFARPLFTLDGSRVLGSELGEGTVDANGVLHAQSSWNVRGIDGHGTYEGTLKSSGGTFTGTQSWSGPEGSAGSRACNAALVPVPVPSQERSASK